MSNEQESNTPIHYDRDYDQQNISWFTPGIEKKGYCEQDSISYCSIAKQEINRKSGGKKEEQENEARKNHN